MAPLVPPDSGITAFSLHSALYSALYFVYRQCIDNVGAGGARAPPEFGGSERGQSLISAYRRLAITASTSGFEKLSTVLTGQY